MNSAQAPVIKSVGNEWVWLANYRAVKTTFYVEIPEGRSVEIGVGIAPQGMPWGARRRLTKSEILKAYGLGCISARVADYEGLCQISIYFQNFPI